MMRSLRLFAAFGLIGSLAISCANAAEVEPAPAKKVEVEAKLGGKPTTPPAKKPASSLDDELLDSLGDEPKKPAKQPEQKPAPKKPASKNPLDDDLLRELGDDAGAKKSEGKGEEAEESDNPLVKLNRQMRDVQQRLAQAEADQQTQEMQQQIVKQLEELIKQLQQQQQQQSSSSSKSQSKQTQQREQVSQPKPQQGNSQSGNKPSQQPARDSSGQVTKRDAEKPDPGKLSDAIKDIWGELPPRLRQQMLQGTTERFLPKYELLIEQYFKALAERKKNATSRP